MMSYPWNFRICNVAKSYSPAIATIFDGAHGVAPSHLREIYTRFQTVLDRPHQT